MFLVNYTSIKLGGLKRNSALASSQDLVLSAFLIFLSLTFFKLPENIIGFMSLRSFTFFSIHLGYSLHGHVHTNLVYLIHSSFKKKSILPSLKHSPDIPIFILWDDKDICTTAFVTCYDSFFFAYLLSSLRKRLWG